MGNGIMWAVELLRCGAVNLLTAERNLVFWRIRLVVQGRLQLKLRGEPDSLQPSPCYSSIISSASVLLLKFSNYFFKEFSPGSKLIPSDLRSGAPTFGGRMF